MADDLADLAATDANQRRFGVAPPSNGLQDLAAQRQMTHFTKQPNPAAPYLDWVRRIFAQPLQDTGFLPGGQNWGRPVVESMMNFQQGGLTGVAPSLRQSMPRAANTLGDLAQSPAARNVFSTANVGGLPLVEAFWSPRDLSILKKIYGANIDPYTLSGLIQRYLPGRSPVSIRQKAFQLGLKRPEIPPYVRQPGSPSIANDPERAAQVAEMLKKNMTFYQMATEMGDVSPRTLRRYVNENLKTRTLKKDYPLSSQPSAPQLKFQQGEAIGDDEFQRILDEFLQRQQSSSLENLSRQLKTNQSRSARMP